MVVAFVTNNVSTANDFTQVVQTGQLDTNGTVCDVVVLVQVFQNRSEFGSVFRVVHSFGKKCAVDGFDVGQCRWL